MKNICVPATEERHCMHISNRPISRLMLVIKITGDYYYDEGTRWRSWLRHYASSQEVASSIPEGVIEIFH